MEAQPAGSLLSFLAAVPDPRSRHGRQHSLSAILALMCCAIACGTKCYIAIAQWAQDQDIGLMHRLGFTRRPPKMGAICKVLIALNSKALEDALNPWANFCWAGHSQVGRCNQKPSRSMARQLVEASTAPRRQSTYSPS
jgi:DDE_Tnp_1-associated